MMAQVFAILFLLYAFLSMALLPLFLVEDYLKNRDCKARHEVAECVIIYAPKEGVHDGIA